MNPGIHNGQESILLLQLSITSPLGCCTLGEGLVFYYLILAVESQRLLLITCSSLSLHHPLLPYPAAECQKFECNLHLNVSPTICLGADKKQKLIRPFWNNIPANWAIPAWLVVAGAWFLLRQSRWIVFIPLNFRLFLGSFRGGNK